ncbi:MAG: AAA family ATPase [Deltaproteobacteria bacterium]|nr:AAA family ATPase [Deltaproteobacteria bacterium]
MTTFDRALPTLLNLCESHDLFRQAETICVIRDLQGRIRLVCKPTARFDDDQVADLQKQIAAKLGGYFVGPILRTDGAREESRLATSVLQKANGWPTTWPDSYEDELGGSQAIHATKWRCLQRVLSKQSWLQASAGGAPWPLNPKTPSIVAFYSFKGGVGRTTLLGIMAWQLARLRKQVVVVDLDLEAPGVGSLLGVSTERGVLDLMVDHVVSGTVELTGCYQEAVAIPEADAANIRVFPAGTMNWSYLEKLARLDFSATHNPENSDSPAAAALKALLQAIKSKWPDTDYILIDSRAGLHDLGGLSLHGLAHVDVLLSRCSTTDLAGLELTLAALARRRKDDPSVMVHSMAPLAQDDPNDQERTRFRNQVYDLFRNTVYASSDAEVDTFIDGVPAETDNQAPHYPWVTIRHPILERLDTLSGAQESVVFSEEHNAIQRRLAELCEEEPEPDEKSGESDG